MKMLTLGFLLALAATGGEVQGTNEDEAHETGKLIRCPVCQGMPIAESPSQMAQDMMVKVRQMHAEGKTREEIISYYEQRYGEFVRLKPGTQGVNILVWVLPPFALIFAAWWVVSRAKKPAAKDAPPAKQTPTGDENDPYLKAIRNEVEE